MVMATKSVKKISLEKFASSGLVPAEVESLLGQFNGGSFMECHQKIREQYGVWIPELVPVFQRLDAALALKSLPRELAG
jgi:hypothetical protein